LAPKYTPLRISICVAPGEVPEIAVDDGFEGRTLEQVPA